MSSAAVLVAALHIACSAAAEPVREAVVVRSPSGDAPVPAGADELLARVTGELAAAGFRVSVQTLASEGPASAHDVTLGVDQVAAVLLGESSGGEAARCMLVDTIGGAPVLTELRVAAGPDAPHRLALRVADVLRAKLAERRLQPAPPPAEPAPLALPVRAAPKVAARAPASALSLELGALALLRPGAWDTTFMPALTLDARRAARAGSRQLLLGVRLTVAGYGGDVRRHTNDGSLSARQGLGLFDAVLALGQLAVLTPELSVGLGMYGLGVQGASDEPARAHKDVRFVPVAAGGAGISLALGERVALVARGQLGYVTRKLSLRIADDEVARSGGFMVGVTGLVRVTLR